MTSGKRTTTYTREAYNAACISRLTNTKHNHKTYSLHTAHRGQGGRHRLICDHAAGFTGEAKVSPPPCSLYPLARPRKAEIAGPREPSPDGGRAERAGAAGVRGRRTVRKLVSRVVKCIDIIVVATSLTLTARLRIKHEIHRPPSSRSTAHRPPATILRETPRPSEPPPSQCSLLPLRRPPPTAQART